MKRVLPILAVVLAAVCLAFPNAALADTPKPNKGDVAWLTTATALVLLMTVPGLALFYGGLVRSKNMLSVLMQVFYSVCIVSVIWVVYGYSLAFTEGSGALNSYVGGFSRAFLKGMDADTTAATFSTGVVIPEYSFIAFQLTFAAITPALIVGAFAERIKFSAVVLFIPLWVTFVYCPIAHMVWYWAGPDAIAGAAKEVLAAGADAAKKAAATAKLDAAKANAGLIYGWGAIDFAGGTVVHINAGIAGLVAALIVGRRVGYGREIMAPHSLTMTMIGGALLWVGWFGFNAGSALEATGGTALALLNTIVATAAAALAWILVENIGKGHPSMLGAVSGAVAGLVAITPAAGVSGPMGAIVLGFVAGIVCYIFCTTIKNMFRYDDSLDVFGVHCVGGIVGALGTAIVAAPMLGGTGVMDYEAGKIGDYVIMAQLIVQAKAVVMTLVWSGVLTSVILLLIAAIVGLRPSTDQEREGLDLVDHGERAYNY